MTSQKICSNLRQFNDSFDERFHYEKVEERDMITEKIFDSYGTHIDLTKMTEENYKLVQERISKDCFESIVMNSLYYTHGNFVYPSSMDINNITFDEYSGDIAFEAMIVDKLTEKKYEILVNDIQLSNTKSLKLETKEYVEVDTLSSFSNYLNSL